jgi:SAM-dependent methyltransferase
MIYKLSVLALNASFTKRVIAALRKIGPRRRAVDNGALVRKHAPGRSFADVGCMWGIDGANSFLAEDCGATKVVAVDVYPESETFLEEKERRNSAVQFVPGDINLRETTEQIGVLDVVLCSGVLYHTPDPVRLLRQLRAMCRETLILNTQSIPEMHGIRNAAVFYPFLPAEQRRIWDRHVGNQKAIRGPYEPASGYGNWFWGLTPSAIESMLRCAGFAVTERHVSPFTCIFVCRTMPPQFVAESGAWVTATT